MLAAGFFGLAALFLSAATAKHPSHPSVASAVTLLYQNNLNFTDDVNHASYLLLSSDDSYTKAEAACASYSEQLLSVAQARQNTTDLSAQLAYQVYRGSVASGETLWLRDGTVRIEGSRLSISSSLKSKSGSHKALCTQSNEQTTSYSSTATSSNRVNVKSSANGNTYEGYRNKKSFRFLGIPYSNTPSRWEYSKLNSARSQTVDATKFGDECVQTGSGAMSEQCLFLNVYTPYLPSPETASNSNTQRRDVSSLSKRSSKALRPVVVWIHGGAFTGGSGSDPTVDGANMASRGDVILVTINYRLSTLGFLAIPGTDIKGNYGLADQITALEWVQQNIQYFGGDPNHVTIYGQSAGAGSVRALLASPKARGKFSAGMLGSNLGGYNYGTTYSEYYTPEQEYQVAGQAIVNATGCSSVPTSGLRACLEKASATALVQQTNVARYVIVDGTYIVADKLDVINPRNTANVPLLYGIMAEDGAPFISYANSGTTRQQAIGSILYGNQSVYDARVNNDEALFPLGAGNNASLSAFNLSAQITTDVVFRCIDQATAYSGLKHGVFPSIYFYQFERAYQTPGFDPNAPTCDAPKTAAKPLGDPDLPYLRCHSGDLYFEFGSLNEFGMQFRDDNDLYFTRLIMDYWTSFVRTHNPNPDTRYLAARQYNDVAATLRKSGRWEAVPRNKKTGSLRLLDIVPQQAAFERQAQCVLEGLPVTFYE